MKNAFPSCFASIEQLRTSASQNSQDLSPWVIFPHEPGGSAAVASSSVSNCQSQLECKPNGSRRDVKIMNIDNKKQEKYTTYYNIIHIYNNHQQLLTCEIHHEDLLGTQDFNSLRCQFSVSQTLQLTVTNNTLKQTLDMQRRKGLEKGCDYLTMQTIKETTSLTMLRKRLRGERSLVPSRHRSGTSHIKIPASYNFQQYYSTK